MGCAVLRICCVLCVCTGGSWASQVSGSSRQDLLAVSCFVGTPPACCSSAVALISGSLVFVISQSLTLSFRALSCISRYILFETRLTEAFERSSETTPLL
ncbi:putative potassium transport system protein kup 1 [Dissostichus eleginoides]|uniref:Potassium transport system protein kup 1 n=1 Tax=Dissostichus eleginoides TaxID=100907 RepID=A0AAD9CFU8_DISEL|nr:putative potassium transport system protein kup 1 [Dissostichus eleginoides]